MTKINNITDEQWAQIEACRKRWLHDEQIAQYPDEVIRETVYETLDAIGQKRVPVWVVDSPMEARILSALSRGGQQIAANLVTDLAMRLDEENTIDSPRLPREAESAIFNSALNRLDTGVLSSLYGELENLNGKQNGDIKAPDVIGTVMATAYWLLSEVGNQVQESTLEQLGESHDSIGLLDKLIYKTVDRMQKGGEGTDETSDSARNARRRTDHLEVAVAAATKESLDGDLGEGLNGVFSSLWGAIYNSLGQKKIMAIWSTMPSSRSVDGLDEDVRDEIREALGDIGARVESKLRETLPEWASIRNDSLHKHDSGKLYSSLPRMQSYSISHETEDLLHKSLDKNLFALFWSARNKLVDSFARNSDARKVQEEVGNANAMHTDVQGQLDERLYVSKIPNYVSNALRILVHGYLDFETRQKMESRSTESHFDASDGLEEGIEASLHSLKENIRDVFCNALGFTLAAGVLQKIGLMRSAFNASDEIEAGIDKSLISRVDDLDKECFEAAKELRAAFNVIWDAMSNFEDVFTQTFNSQPTLNFYCGIWWNYRAGWFEGGKILGVPEHESYEKFMRWNRHCPVWMWDDSQVFILRRPKEIHWDENESWLHNESGPAAYYSPDFQLWMIDGVRVDEQVVMRPETQTIEQIEAEENEEVKRIRIERFGVMRYIEESESEVIDSRRNEIENTYEILTNTPDGQRLICHCPSTSRKYFLGLPDEVKTCEEAQKSLWGGHDINVIGRT